MSKPTTPATVLALMLSLAAVAAAAGCGGPAQPRVEGPAPSASRAVGPVYVSDPVVGQPLRRPTSFGTEHTSLSRLSWRSWGKEKAVATGRVTGMWCMPDCAKSGYPATVELSRLVRQENVSYYTRATVRSTRLPPEQARELRDLPLPVPKY
ncbi:hypothetical protein [Streptomyces gobiensis]|uniref:hypothetical protein n=1 Tax=Streptomyces gobiensis TaxID=2875706 RepID=UPI001E28FC47|nr:hypothetical protein [Streptomyces gobiensis]UGY91473.1 hypothetical protein test1122_06900 [Streptomyces gobiensis]